MERGFILLLLLGVVVVIQGKSCSESSSHVYSKVFKSPQFSTAPGEVQNRFYMIEFPKGHVAVRNFHAKVVDEHGKPVPLTDIYLHHWAILQLYVRSPGTENYDTTIFAGNDGLCQNKLFSQFWGLGLETRHTSTRLSYPYGVNIGDPSKIPEGYKEIWMLNLHTIDTRGTEDPDGCLECRCNLYNVTHDEFGRPLGESYKGGLHCCYDETHCKLKEGFRGEILKVHLQYSIDWFEWDECVVPVRTYILDVTDTGKRDETNGGIGCQLEYEIPLCNSQANGCTNVTDTFLTMPKGGHLIYGVSHQHKGGKGMTLYGQDGRELGKSLPIYGTGTETGNEAGYIVGMTTTYPKPGTVIIKDQEVVRVRSDYSSNKEHVGVMGIFYLTVADETAIPSAIHGRWNLKEHDIAMVVCNPFFVAIALMALFGVGAVLYSTNKKQSQEYQRVPLIG